MEQAQKRLTGKEIIAREERARKEKNISHEHFYKYLYAIYQDPYHLPYCEYERMCQELPNDDMPLLIGLYTEYERLLEEVEYLRSKLGIPKDPYEKISKEQS